MQRLPLAVVLAAGGVGASACSPTLIKPQSTETLVTFTLIRGGEHRDAYNSFINSRDCLRGALPSTLPFDDVIFHEGNVPALIQDELVSRM
eukprot:2743089-Prymnesium_polylepis.1